MKISLSFLLLTLCTAVLAQSDDTTTAQATTETTQIATETTQATTETTQATTETTVTTALPTTLETTPSSTVSSSTASSSTASSTTVSSSTDVSGSTGQPTTTPSPVTTEIPAPDTCPFNVTQENVTCIKADLKVQFTITNEGRKSYVNLGCDARTVYSDCISSNVTQTLVLSEANLYNLTLIFAKESDNKYSLSNMTFDYVVPGGEISVSNNEKQFVVKIGNSYLCKSESVIHFENVTMEATMHLQAFGVKDGGDFGSAEECEADDKVGDVVPIAVGIALAALIIIVLIAYLVGRRRSRQRGYQSV